MRPPRRGTLRSPVPQPFLQPRDRAPWHPPLPCILAPPAPRHPDTQFPPDCRATAPSPDRRAGCAVSRDPGRATSEGRTRTRRRASPRRHLAVPLLFPAERGRRGQALRRSGGGSQIGSSLLAAPLPPPWRPAVGRAPTFPGPLFQPRVIVKSRQAAAGGAGDKPPLAPG